MLRQGRSAFAREGVFASFGVSVVGTELGVAFGVCIAYCTTVPGGKGVSCSALVDGCGVHA